MLKIRVGLTYNAVFVPYTDTINNRIHGSFKPISAIALISRLSVVCRL